MEQVIEAYRSVSASDEFKEIERLRSKARHDEASALNNAERKGLQKGLQKGLLKGLQEGLQEGLLKGHMEKADEIARNLKAVGRMTVDEIAKATGLTLADIRRL